MTPLDIAKIQARLDATNDARTAPNTRELCNLQLYANARRDISRLLGYVADLERDNRILREMRATSEHVTSYQAIRPPNQTMRPDLLVPAGSADIPIVEPIEDSIELGELVRERITGLMDAIEAYEHRSKR